MRGKGSKKAARRRIQTNFYYVCFTYFFVIVKTLKSTNQLQQLGVFFTLLYGSYMTWKGRRGVKNRDVNLANFPLSRYFPNLAVSYLQSKLFSPHCLHAGPQPSEQYGTRASFGLSPSVDTSRWSAAITSPPGDKVALSICSAPDAPVGRYTLSLGRSGRIEFILLFNPWCPGG